jgi:signal transduction histidine kinase/DNA-binding response OmpR family regulator
MTQQRNVYHRVRRTRVVTSLLFLAAALPAWSAQKPIRVGEAMLQHQGWFTTGIVLVIILLLIILQFHRQLRDARQAAENAGKAKVAFLANMSHEIRTPMNAVIGMTDLLIETNLSNEQHESADIIRASGEALLKIINEILDFSKIEAGSMDLDEKDFDLPKCIEDTLDMIVPEATEKGLNIHYDIDDSVPGIIRGDTARVQQILLNLLNNAIKFTHEGEISLTVTARQVGSSHEIECAVRDTGIGIPPETIDHIFSAFTQADPSTTRQYGGTGLGLSISKRLAELMGGRLWVESTLGTGSIFHFTLLTSTAKSARPARPDLDISTLRTRDVLLVDDSKTNLKILTAQLTRWGFNPVAFSDPKAAITSIQSGRKYALMITDMQMPGIDGAMLTLMVRDIHTMTDLPIILLTSIGFDASMSSLAVSTILVKPVRPAQLLGSISSALQGTADDAQKAEAAVEISKTLSPLRILVAEDNLLNQTVALRMLEKLDYQADLARDGIEALDLAEKNTYDLILMDIQMPRMDGLTATTKLLERHQGRPRPLIIGMTAHASDDERKEGLAAGMDDYLTKPIQLAKLDDVLRKIQAQKSV